MPADPLQIVASTADPAFAVDENCRIVIWNKAAEELLGYRAADVLGRSCHEVLEGRDIFGNRFCGQNCPLHRMVRRQEAISSFLVDFRVDRGQRQRMEVSIVAVPGPRAAQYSLVHLLRTARGDPPTSSVEEPRNRAGGRTEDSTCQSAVLYSLTPREVEILEALAKGWSTQQIADRLYISVATVRNHVQNVLRKLEVHSKVEAVSLALRERLI